MHEMVLVKIGLKNPEAEIKSKITQVKDYKEIFDEIEKRQLTEEEQKQKDLKRMVWGLKRVPMFAKDELIKLIDGDKEIRQDVISSIDRYKSEIKKTWPKELQDFVFKRVKEIS